MKNCYQQLKETKVLLEKEQEINNQLTKSIYVLEQEKMNINVIMMEKNNENSELQRNILELQANSLKDHNLFEEMKLKLKSQEKLNEMLQEQLQQSENTRVVVEQDKDELQSQLLIVTDERDSARVKEEELYEKLQESIADLERLQESYVDIADRCNDAQDEVSELRDQIESLKVTLANTSRTTSILQSSFNSSNNSNCSGNTSGSSSNSMSNASAYSGLTINPSLSPLVKPAVITIAPPKTIMDHNDISSSKKSSSKKSSSPSSDIGVSSGPLNQLRGSVNSHDDHHTTPTAPAAATEAADSKSVVNSRTTAILSQSMDKSETAMKSPFCADNIDHDDLNFDFDHAEEDFDQYDDDFDA